MMEQHHLFQLPYVEQLLPGTKNGFLQWEPGDSTCCDSLIDLPLLSDKCDASENLPWLIHKGTSIPLCKSVLPSTAAGSTFHPR